jgi:hypothetical protein
VGEVFMSGSDVDPPKSDRKETLPTNICNGVHHLSFKRLEREEVSKEKD